MCQSVEEVCATASKDIHRNGDWICGVLASDGSGEWLQTLLKSPEVAGILKSGIRQMPPDVAAFGDRSEAHDTFFVVNGVGIVRSE